MLNHDNLGLAPLIYESPSIDQPDVLLWDPVLRYGFDLMCPLHDTKLKRPGRWAEDRKDEGSRLIYNIGEY